MWLDYCLFSVDYKLNLKMPLGETVVLVTQISAARWCYTDVIVLVIVYTAHRPRQRRYVIVDHKV